MLLKVTWLDAVGTTGWECPEIAEAWRCTEIETVGHIVNDQHADRIILARGKSSNGDYEGVFSIPKASIIKQEILKLCVND